MNPCTCERLLHEADCPYDGPPITAGQDHDPRPLADPPLSDAGLEED